MTIDFKILCIPELQLDQLSKNQIINLLRISFPDENFDNKHYFKQLPHIRILLKSDKELIGQLGLDYRVMTLNEQPIYVLGLIDLAIQPHYRGQGYARAIMMYLEKWLLTFNQNVDFILLSTEQYALYEKFGFLLTSQTVTWLTVDQHKQFGLKTEWIDDCLMVKSVGEKKWNHGGKLDLLGYWY